MITMMWEAVMAWLDRRADKRLKRLMGWRTGWEWSKP